MPDFSTQKRLAASVLDAGESRIWINPDPEVAGDIADSITREDIRAQIEAGNIKAKPKKGNSRARYRARAAKRAYGHQKGQGRRKGRKGARSPRKEMWMTKIRALRRRLRELREGRRSTVRPKGCYTGRPRAASIGAQPTSTRTSRQKL